jgi:hypothetical protein
MRSVRLGLAILALAAACTRTGTTPEPSPEPTQEPSPSVEPAGPRLADGSALPAGCTGGAGPQHTVAFVADGRAWALDPTDGDVACLFPIEGNPAPFAWGPQGDRVLLGGFVIRGVAADAPDFPSVGVHLGPFDWGHPMGLAVVFADQKGDPRKRYMDDGRVERLTSLPEGRYLEVAYHPSGLALAFVVEGDEGQEIWLSTNEGADPQRLVFSEAGTTFPSIAFTPNGKQLWWTAAHAGGLAELHWMDLADRSGFGTSWNQPTDGVAENLKIAPRGRLKSLDLGSGCEDRQALVVAGNTGTPALPDEERPTTALGWLDPTTLLVAAGGCGEPEDLYAVDGTGDQDPALLVLGVELAAPRTVVANPPRDVPAPPSEELPPQGGVG